MDGAGLLIDAIDQGELTDIVSRSIKEDFGNDRAAIIEVAGAANSNERAAENWVRGKNTPDALHLLRLMARSPALQAEIRRLIGMETDIDPELARDMSAAIRTFQRLQGGGAR